MSLVVERSAFGESCAPAVDSLRAFRGKVYDVHVEGPGAVDKETLDAIRRESGALEVQSAPRVDPTSLRCDAVVRMAADVTCTRGAVECLLRDMRTKSHRYDHFAVESTVVCERGSGFLGELTYGWLLVLMVLDTVASILTAKGAHRSVDLRGTILYRTYPNRVYVPRRRWWTWLLFTRVCYARYIEDACAQTPDPADQGAALTWRSIRTHATGAWGFMWLTDMLMYYYVFAIPWWTFLAPSAKNDLLATLLSPRDFAAVYWLSPLAINMLLVVYVAHQWLVVPRSWLLALQVFLYPLYLTTFPLVYLVARWIPPRPRAVAKN